MEKKKEREGEGESKEREWLGFPQSPQSESSLYNRCQ